MPATYEPIATTTLGTNTASIVFSSIPGTYTDLRMIVANLTGTVATSSASLTFGPSAGSTSSWLSLYSAGSTVNSARVTSSGNLQIGTSGVSTTMPSFATIDIFNYANTSLFKQSIVETSEDFNTSGNVTVNVNLWKSLSAITSITLSVGGFLKTGTTATLYGIKAA